VTVFAVGPVDVFARFVIAERFVDVEHLVRTEVQRGEVSRDIFEIALGEFVDLRGPHHQGVGAGACNVILHRLDDVFARKSGDAWREFARGSLTVSAVTQCATLVYLLSIGHVGRPGMYARHEKSGSHN